jgi:hypothetical protein
MMLDELSRKLFATSHGLEVDRLVKRLMKLGRENPEPIIQILFEYARRGPVEHWRSFVIPDILRLLKTGQTEYRGSFEQLLEDPTTRYWSVDGLIKTAGRESYAILTSMALDASNAMGVRAKAIKCLADHSGQTFTRGRPTDPGYWTEAQLPLDELRQWAQARYPRSPGFPTPARHPDMDAPRSELDRLAQALDAKLAKARAARQDLANPTNWLTPAPPAELAAIQSMWQLPDVYLEFLRKFSPLCVTIWGRGCSLGLNLYGATELVKEQRGYLFDSDDNLPGSQRYVVIATMSSDPFVLDLSKTKDGDAPVLTALHGMGEWDFTKVSAKFQTFLRRLGK